MPTEHTPLNKSTVALIAGCVALLGVIVGFALPSLHSGEGSAAGKSGDGHFSIAKTQEYLLAKEAFDLSLAEPPNPRRVTERRKFIASAKYITLYSEDGQIGITYRGGHNALIVERVVPKAKNLIFVTFRTAKGRVVSWGGTEEPFVITSKCPLAPGKCLKAAEGYPFVLPAYQPYLKR